MEQAHTVGEETNGRMAAVTGLDPKIKAHV